MRDTMKAFAKKNSDKTIRLFFIGLMIAIICMFSHNAYAKTAAEINADANRTLKRFYKEVNGAKELTSSAKALLVMSGVTKAGFFVGGEYGQGVLRIKGKSQGYYNLVAGSYGLTFGAEQMDIIIAFMTEEALREFKEIDGWEVGVTGNVAIIDVGGGKRLDTTSLKDPVVAFVFGAKGLMVDVSLKGAKFTKINK
jgi:lipid-binding SYLF domain-containing protein